MIRVKICGLTNLADALVAVAAGADALGFVLAESPRRVSPEVVREIVAALPPLVTTVGVFVRETPAEAARLRDELGLTAMQLHGAARPGELAGLGGPARVLRVCRVGRDPLPGPADWPGATVLLDTYQPGQAGGTGQSFDWGLARELAAQRPVILAGGLGPHNVQMAISAARPYAVDVASGVEAEPGKKDHDKLREFLRRAKTLD
ncbi:MAG: phosphoribosylanthranilate isomerase [Deltaproteobacteria bacterium]|nr:phosphoribosylanthranilate isomerase [Deltaproteobacteria bacterium]